MSAANTSVALSSEELLLESLFVRLNPSPASLLRAAVRFATDHPGDFKPDVMLDVLKLRGEQQTAEWLKKMQPALGIQDVMTRTGLSKSGVHKAKEEGRMLAFRLRGQNFDHFPLFQFKEGKVREWIPRLLSLTDNGLAGAHFISVARKRLNGRAYVDLLRDDEDEATVPAMLRHAESVGDDARGVSEGTATRG